MRERYWPGGAASGNGAAAAESVEWGCRWVIWPGWLHGFASFVVASVSQVGFIDKHKRDHLESLERRSA